MRVIPHWRWFKKEIQQSSKREWIISLAVSLLLIAAGFVLLVVAGHYLHTHYRNLPPLPDIVHDILPIIDLRFLTRIGLLTSLVLFMVGLLNEPNRIPAILFMASFWFVIRVASMTVTPFGIPEGSLPEYSEIKDIQSFWDFVLTGLNTPSVLFFSGHTGLPLLGFLVFRRTIFCRYLIWPMLIVTIFYFARIKEYPEWLLGIIAAFWILIFAFRDRLISLSTIFLIWSFVMATSVLLTRAHYAVDVVGAYFMTPGIFLIGKAMFGKIDAMCDKIADYFDEAEEQTRA